MEKEKIHTFVICAYKESNFLEDCILSVRNQSLASKVIISTSTPNEYIKNLAKKYDIELFTHKKSGIGIDWNAALAVADTQYVTIAHQDDIYLTDFATKNVEAMQRNKQSLIAFSDYAELKDEKVLEPNRNLKIKKICLTPIAWFPNSKFWRRASISLGNSICCPAVTYNMHNLRGFTFNETDFRSNLDWDAWDRISKKDGVFCYTPVVQMHHRIHENSETTNAIENNVRTKEDRELFERFWPKPIVNILMRFYVKSQNTNSMEKVEK